MAKDPSIFSDQPKPDSFKDSVLIFGQSWFGEILQYSAPKPLPSTEASVFFLCFGQSFGLIIAEASAKMAEASAKHLSFGS